MTAIAHEVLAAYDALKPAEKQAVAVEILRRSAGVGELPEEAFTEVAAEVFQSYDAEEAASADR